MIKHDQTWSNSLTSLGGLTGISAGCLPSQSRHARWRVRRAERRSPLGVSPFPRPWPTLLGSPGSIGDDHWWPPCIWCQWSYLVISRVGIVFWTSFPPPASCESVSPVVFSANTWASWASSFQECLPVIRGKNGKGECIRLPLYPTYLQTPAAEFCRTCPTDLLISVPTWSNTWNGSDGLLGWKELPPQGWRFFRNSSW